MGLRGARGIWNAGQFPDRRSAREEIYNTVIGEADTAALPQKKSKKVIFFRQYAKNQLTIL
jgi:hypothetical protein